VNCSNPNCTREIRRGERYVAIDRHIETETNGNFIDRARGHRNVVKVEDAEMVAAYHLECAPPKS
jgi:hypothetical protein